MPTLVTPQHRSQSASASRSLRTARNSRVSCCRRPRRVSLGTRMVIAVGDAMLVKVIATPGHTFTHLSYALADAASGTVAAVFTGGSLLHGSTGRPDLLGPAHKTALATAQHASARRLAAELPDSTPVCPTHGFGSFCSATQAEGSASTIGQEKRVNPVLILDEDQYVRTLLAGLDAYPAYYAHMGPANAVGPEALQLSPPVRADAAGVSARIAAGEWVADLRSRRAFAAGHVSGSLSFEYGSDFTNYLGWLLPWGTPLTLLGDTAGHVAPAQRDLAAVAEDRPRAERLGIRSTGPIQYYPPWYRALSARPELDLTVYYAYRQTA